MATTGWNLKVMRGGANRLPHFPDFLLSRFPVGSSASKIAGPFAIARGEFLQAMINSQPNTQLVRDALLRGETVRSGRCSSISFNKPCGMLPVCRQNSWGNSRRDQNGCASNATSSLEAIAISAVWALYDQVDCFRVSKQKDPGVKTPHHR